jgi:hypothetical protein
MGGGCCLTFTAVCKKPSAVFTKPFVKFYHLFVVFTVYILSTEENGT